MEAIGTETKYSTSLVLNSATISPLPFNDLIDGGDELLLEYDEASDKMFYFPFLFSAVKRPSS